MLQKLRARLDRGEEGFTLIELMVVVLIIAILLAIAIPSFLGARSKAQDRASQSNARNALTAEKTYYVDNQAYASDVNLTAANIEPSLTYANGLSATQGSKQVGIVVADNGTITGAIVCVTSVAANGNFFTVKDIAAGTGAGTYFYKGTAAVGACDNSTVAATWGAKW